MSEKGLLGWADEIEDEEIPAALAEMAAAQTSLASRLMRRKKPAEKSDNLLEVEEAAIRLSVSEDFLYRTKDLPFAVRIGRRLRFSANGIDQYLRERRGKDGR